MRIGIMVFSVLMLIFKGNIYAQKYTIYENIAVLGSDSMGGRLVGTASEEKSALYISQIFEHYHLEPAYKNSYFQYFNFNTNPHKHLNDSTITDTTIGKGINVAAFLDNKSSKTIAIGAHYDHIGKNEYSQSLDNNSSGKIHNGADDNASGVAGVLELARIYATNNITEKFNFLFICFSGEELGLIGSKAAVPYLKEKYSPSVMINMDMIGRMDTQKNLYIGGFGTSPVFSDIIPNLPASFQLQIDSSGIGPSDHTSFYLDSIPVLFFSTGSHQDYHQPSDDIAFINFKEMNSIIQYIDKIVIALSQRNNIPFRSSGSAITKKSKFKITLGILPNYASTGNGLMIDGVTAGKTASKLGLQKGDKIIQINNCPVNNVYDYMECLSQLSYNETISITFLRNKETIKKHILLEKTQ